MRKTKNKTIIILSACTGLRGHLLDDGIHLEAHGHDVLLLVLGPVPDLDLGHESAGERRHRGHRPGHQRQRQGETHRDLLQVRPHYQPAEEEELEVIFYFIGMKLKWPFCLIDL